MTKRIFRAIVAASGLALFLSLALLIGILHEYLMDFSAQQLRVDLNLAARGVAARGADYFQDAPSDPIRLTWIAPDGTVLYDSGGVSVADMENHLQREEVQKAKVNGYGESRRRSDTMMQDFLYAAKEMPDGSILRLSVAQDSVWSLLLGVLQPILLVLLFALLVSWWFAARLSRQIVAPLNALDLDAPVEQAGYDEIAPLIRQIRSQKAALLVQERHLLQKQEELSYILENMKEGMILLAADGTIVGINPAAEELLQARRHREGERLLELCRDMELLHMVEAARRGTPGEKLLTLHGRKYQAKATPILETAEKGEKTVRGVTVFFFDVTEKEAAEQRRREFTANVSHELKTPLHSISGYAELLQAKLVAADDIPSFAGKIYRESQRATHMVENILRLSHLDEGAGEVGWEHMDAGRLAAEIVDSLRPKAEAKGIALSFTGEEAMMIGKPALYQTIVANLCDNAIKYSSGGSVQVCVEKKDGEVILCVRDQGIGIAAADQERIFERFYRVDKSRSRESGSTGLGLSIVKNAVRIHRGRIHMKSELGKGTQITVAFPTGGEQSD